MTFEGLVPDDFEEFRSVKFWDGFFQKRRQKAFEWYGEWRQLQPLVWGACARPPANIDAGLRQLRSLCADVGVSNHKVAILQEPSVKST